MQKEIFKITASDKDDRKISNARIGNLITRHGIIQTPAFLPVASKGTGKFVTSDDYKNCNTNAIICNALLISMSLSWNTIMRMGLHNFMGFDKVIFTDCGGFQMIRGQLLNSVTSRGIIFINPLTKQKIFLTPEKCIEIQNALGSDVALALDCVIPYNIEATKQDFAKAVQVTNEWMYASKRYFDFKESNKKARVNQLLFGITQGGVYEELRKKSTEFIVKLDFDGIAIGGLSMGEDKEKMHKIISLSTNLIPENKPRYVMGLGSVLDIIKAVECGVDLFDSCYPMQNARHYRLFTKNMKSNIIDISKIIYSKDKNPIDKSCLCTTCKNFSRAYIHHLVKIKEPAVKRLCTIHNLWFMQNFMKEIAVAIKENSLAKLKKQYTIGCVG